MSGQIRASLLRTFANRKPLKSQNVEPLLNAPQIPPSHSSLLHQCKHHPNHTLANYLPTPIPNAYLYKRAGVNLRSRNFSSFNGKDELTVEQEAERKIGWLLKLLFAGTASLVAYQFFPFMGDNLLQQSVSLLQVKDPLFKRMGASRLTRFAIDDKRRMKVVEMGGAQELLIMLNTAKDDRTRKAALKALDALSRSDEVLASLHQAGAISIIRSTPNSLEDADIERFKLCLMKRFQDQRYDVSLS
ncbi:armadillo/beta-catenin-like repeat protein [Senna tora]|uniref:Armadillo/beta-catenin-like repeat protein n=1 Tax=Senna tora TaxID=362788 RepID=A0A834WSQ5_9FABA|nr:armadillo/beta-catenin-like repeat protein [Senna tora]